ncbi:MAG: family 10 glycosylhydrolase, partial [Duncaniella sp.]|nr:family 10 glycosylhydrolase [Duncaniella sp.]
MKKVILLHILLAVLWNSVTVVAQDIPKRELRGVWIATVWGIDWPSKAGCGPKVSERQRRELAELLDRCKRMNLTTVYFQVRSMGDVMYESRREPWSAFVSGQRGVSPGWDPLEFVVGECHSRGLEFYAWGNPFRWSSGSDYNTAPDREWKERGWLMSHGKYTVFNPGLEEVRSHIVDVCREIVEGY